MEHPLQGVPPSTRSLCVCTPVVTNRNRRVQGHHQLHVLEQDTVLAVRPCPKCFFRALVLGHGQVSTYRFVVPQSMGAR